MAPADRKLDDAARAAWLSYIGGKKQEEIAAILGISRQSAQRLVSQATSAGLVKFRIDHPIARCAELADTLRDQYELTECQVVPSMNSVEASGMAVAAATGDLIERWLTSEAPLIVGMGTGRTLRAAIDHMPHLTCDQHRIVSLTGSIAPDGSTAFYNVLFTITDKVTAPTYPLPVPVIAGSAAERETLLGQTMLQQTRHLAQHTDIRFIGVGTLGKDAPLLLDGFINQSTLNRIVDRGGIGEILGWIFDADGKLVDDEINARVSSVHIDPTTATLPQTIACAQGPDKVPAIRAALTGKLITGLITDEDTAIKLIN